MKELAFRRENDDTSVIRSARANTTATVLILKVGCVALLFSFVLGVDGGNDRYETLNR